VEAPYRHISPGASQGPPSPPGSQQIYPYSTRLTRREPVEPILFGIFMSELLRQLQKDFPHAYTYTSKGNIWLGAIAYVDDLVLISKSPHELQAMLNTCQSWCEKSRVEINLEKTKIMIFNSRLQQTPKQPSHTWSITAQYLPRDHPQKTTTLKVVDSFKYLGVPIDSDLFMGPLHTIIRDNIQKANGKLQSLLRDLKSSRELHSSHHTTLGPKPRKIFRPITPCPHFQYLATTI
jgi:hypothetical protein